MKTPPKSANSLPSIARTINHNPRKVPANLAGAGFIGPNRMDPTKFDQIRVSSIKGDHRAEDGLEKLERLLTRLPDNSSLVTIRPGG